MDKDAVSALGTPELAQFPLDDFFDHYEKGLRKVCSVVCVFVAVQTVFCQNISSNYRDCILIN